MTFGLVTNLHRSVQLLLNPSIQHKALEEGLGYISDLVCRLTVIERIYMQQKVSRPDSSCPEDIKRLRQGFEVRVTTLYSEILEYQVRVVCHPDHKLVKLGRDIIAADGWVELLVEIKKSELSCGDFTQVLDKEILDHAFKVQNRHMEELLQAQDKRFNKVAEAIVTALKVRSEEHRTNEEIDCHRVFRTSDYEAQKNRNPRRVNGTCNWFLQHPIYKQWRDQEKDSLLWVSADPGCGKSVLSRSLIDNEFRDMDSYTVCYFFFKDDNENQKNAKNALCSILHQLFEEKPHLLKHSVPAFRQNGNKLPELFDRLWSIFTSIATDPEAGNIICVLDALDECKASDRADLVDKLNQLYQHTTENGPEKSALKFLVTSRPYETIENIFDPSTIRLAGEEESDAIRQEIDLVIKDKVPTIALKLRVKDQPWFEPFLEQKLTSMPHRTYLWLHLIVEAIILRQDHLSAGVTKKNLEAVVNSIPGTVDDAYTTILEKSPNKLLAKKLLHIVVAAKRPLTLGEMNIAMNVGDEIRSYYDLGLESEDRFRITIRNLCGLFVSVIDSKIFLLHQTAKEFLITKSNAAASHTDVQPHLGFWKHSLEPGKSNSVLAEACISYLLFSVFEEAPLILYEKDKKYERIMRYCEEHKFLHYSSLYWATHFREAVCIDEALPNMALDICGTGTKRLQTWITVTMVSRYWSNYFGITNLMITSHFGLVLLVQLLLDNGANLSDRDEKGKTALHWAARQGHESVTRLLLDREANVSATNKQGWTALLSAACRGHESVTRLLLNKGANLSDTDEQGRTALHWAAIQGHESTTRLLLDRKADVSATDEQGSTALHFAVSRGHEPMTRLLLDRGANVSDTDKQGKTALHWAADIGHEPVTRLLLDREANVSATDKWGMTALHLAALQGHEPVTRLLLDREANVSATDKWGMTALHLAASQGREPVTRLLLDREADVSDTDEQGRTALHFAAKEGREPVTRLLLNKGAKPSATTTSEKTALDLARMRKSGRLGRSDYDAVIQLLEPITKPTTTTTEFSRSSVARS